MNINQVFSGNFLKAEDLQGRTVKVTISKVEVKEFDDGNKLVVYFQGKDKSLVCNKTNCSVMQEVTGSDDTDNWAGATIMLTVRKVEFQGKLVPALRILLPDQVLPAPAKPVVASAKPEVDDSVPF